MVQAEGSWAAWLRNSVWICLGVVVVMTDMEEGLYMGRVISQEICIREVAVGGGREVSVKSSLFPTFSVIKIRLPPLFSAAKSRRVSASR